MAIDLKQTRVVQEHKHSSPLISCRFQPGTDNVLFGAQDNRVWRWEPASDRKVEYAGHDSWVRGLAFTASGQVLTAGFDGRLILWSGGPDAPEPVRVQQAHDGWARAVAVSPDNQLVCTVGNDLLVKLWRLDTGELQQTFRGHQSHVYNVAFHPNGKRLATGDLKGNVFDWELGSDQPKRSFELKSLCIYDKTFQADIGGVRAMAFSGDGKLLACSGITNVTNAFAGVGNPVVEVWDWETGKQKIQLLSKGKLRGVGWGVAFHAEGSVIGLSGGGGGGHVLFWKLDAKDEYHQFKLPNTARDLAMNSAGTRLATAHYDGNLRILSLEAK